MRHLSLNQVSAKQVASVLLFLAFAGFTILNIFMGERINYALMIATLTLLGLVVLKPLQALSLLVLMIGVPILKTVGTITTYLILVVFVLMFLKHIVKRTKFQRTALDFPIVILVAANLLSFVNTEHAFLKATVINLSVVLSCVAIYYLVVHCVKDMACVKTVCKVLGILLVLQWMLGFYQLLQLPEIPALQFLGIVPLGQGSTRPMGSFLDSFTYSFFMTVNALGLAYLFLTNNKISRKAMYGAGICICVLMILAVASKANFILVILSLPVFVAVMGTRLPLWRYFCLSVLIGGAIYMGLFFFESYAVTELSPIKRLQQTSFSKYLIPDTREDLYRFYIEKIKEHPIVGQGMYDVEAIVDEGVPWYLIFNTPAATHSSYLFQLYTTGIVGLVPFLAIFLTLFYQNRKLLSVRVIPLRNGGFLHIIGFFQIFWILFLIWGISMDFQRTIPFQHYVWTLIGLNVAILNLARKGQSISEFHNRLPHSDIRAIDK